MGNISNVERAQRAEEALCRAEREEEVEHRKARLKILKRLRLAASGEAPGTTVATSVQAAQLYEKISPFSPGADTPGFTTVTIGTKRLAVPSDEMEAYQQERAAMAETMRRFCALGESEKPIAEQIAEYRRATDEAIAERDRLEKLLSENATLRAKLDAVELRSLGPPAHAPPAVPPARPAVDPRSDLAALNLTKAMMPAPLGAGTYLRRLGADLDYGEPDG